MTHFVLLILYVKMQNGFSTYIQIYSSWGCGLIPLSIIWIIFLNFNTRINSFSKKENELFKFNIRTILIIFLGLILSIAPLREINTLQNNNFTFSLTKASIATCWAFGFTLVSLLKNKNTFSSKHTTICSLFSLVYIWQIALSAGHPIVLLICLEINLILFLIICVEDSFSESILLNILLLLWMGAFASILAFLGLKGFSANNSLLDINIIWLAVLLLKFILVPAQITLFGIYQRWTNYNLVVYLGCYYIPMLYLILPVLNLLTLVSSIVSLCISFFISLLTVLMITQFESTNAPVKTIAFSSLITLMLLFIITLVI